MGNMSFVLPTIGSEAMSKNDQSTLLVNQAAVAIVDRWLDHAQWVHESSRTAGVPHNELGEWRTTPDQLVALIIRVQNALRSVQ